MCDDGFRRREMFRPGGIQQHMVTNAANRRMMEPVAFLELLHVDAACLQAERKSELNSSTLSCSKASERKNSAG
jgi:hypothetical protein